MEELVAWIAEVSRAVGLAVVWVNCTKRKKIC